MVSRIIFTGSRGWTDRELIAESLQDADEVFPDLTVVVGYDPKTRHPKGSDELVFEEAEKLGLPIDYFPASWKTYGNKAGFIRNEQMAEAGADWCVAFWDLESRGTFDMITKALKHGIKVTIVPSPT